MTLDFCKFKRTVVIKSENGLLHSPEIKFILKDQIDFLNLSYTNIDKIIIE
jgi:hypothetical protein